ncbi:uncharacterized protein LOC144162540 isoform X4 [Haemaphysalis longicornis]
MDEEDLERIEQMAVAGRLTGTWCSLLPRWFSGPSNGSRATWRGARRCGPWLRRQAWRKWKRPLREQTRRA